MIRSTLTRLLAASALLATPALALAQTADPAAGPAVVEAPVTVPAPAAAPVDADPALWVVRDADTTIYLFGTVHVLRPGLTWFDEAVRTAFDASDEVKVEVVLPDDPTSLAPLFVAAGSYPAGTTLTSRLTPEQRATYEAGLAQFGVPAAAFDPYEPWFVSLQLSGAVFGAMGFTPDNGVEATLKTAAAAANKSVTGFETVDEQLGFFDATPEAEQITGLITFFQRAGEMRGMIDRLIASWTEGKPEDTATIMNESTAQTPETMRILLTDRNRRWADAIRTRMSQPGTVFVAVGAGHLAGDASVQAFLAERGLTAERIVY